MVFRKQKSLLFINQYYWPDHASTGQLLTELCENLAKDFNVTVLAGTPSYSKDRESVQNKQISGKINGVFIKRAFNTTFQRDNILGRLLNYLTFMISALLVSLFTKKHDVTVVMSDPPTVNIVGVFSKLLKRSKLVQICQDVYPELALALKKADNPFLISLFSALNKKAQNYCDRIVAISSSMQEKLVSKGIDPNKAVIHENWIDTKLIIPIDKNNEFSKKYNLDKKFVIMHSGNIGLSQNLHLLLSSAKELESYNDIIFVIIGDGAKKEELVRFAKTQKLSNVIFLPYQDRKNLKLSLSSADIHFASLKRGLEGLIFPSKLYGIMAAKRAIVSCFSKNSELEKLITGRNIGINVDEENPKLIAKAILTFYNDPEFTLKCAEAGRLTVTESNEKDLIVDKYKNLFLSVTQGG